MKHSILIIFWWTKKKLLIIHLKYQLRSCFKNNCNSLVFESKIYNFKFFDHEIRMSDEWLQFQDDQKKIRTFWSIIVLKFHKNLVAKYFPKKALRCSRNHTRTIRRLKTYSIFCDILMISIAPLIITWQISNLLSIKVWLHLNFHTSFNFKIYFLI